MSFAHSPREPGDCWWAELGTGPDSNPGRLGGTFLEAVWHRHHHEGEGAEGREQKLTECKLQGLSPAQTPSEALVPTCKCADALSLISLLLTTLSFLGKL